MNYNKTTERMAANLAAGYTLPEIAAKELNKEDDFFVELRTLLGVDDMRTIRYALESYYHEVREDTDLGCENLEELGNLRGEEDLQAHLEILSKITRAHWAIRYAANKTGVDC